ncbi:AzlC family ABC transporter permease [Halomonas urumqiensis]|uniref:Branched-chain amino acid ABC transporter permease n=1 Tax=Halomonas urumqiensis TaxID=1684789 RepID=A0A2N7UJ75_9GAMM|nr:AzlC family ABC transporter permease [Halomonas urumqiensis]PMR80497.1 branched-chain amino acid ABC transporter permease [Halomonas urumqiensis]PTB01658.1 branched-chain amino acid ABC transporter permease [Halomonas urumqiensis]GHE22256.1 branched-chain amino acid ABC transporter permease [Halomonas urumqiensis]
MSQDNASRPTFHHLVSGFKRMAPLSMFVIVFGLAFGVAALQQGLSGLETLMMSGLVFAGAAQFATLELWGDSIPLIPLVAITLAINARHLLMGAVFYPNLRDLSAPKRYASLILLSDANWAMAMTGTTPAERLGILIGGGVALWTTWMIGTGLGVIFGSAISQPERLGLDAIMGCFLLAMLVGDKRDLGVLVPWSAAALAALAAMTWLPPHAHVIVGALAGGIVGLLMPDRRGEIDS